MIISQLFSATNNLIEQQFYNGQDIIIGRTSEVSLKISKSGQIIRKFKDLFYKNLNLFIEGNYLKFLSQFKKIKGVDDKNIKIVHQEFQLKLKKINEDINILVVYAIVLNSLISCIRELNFEEILKEIRKRIKFKIKTSGAKIQDELEKMFMKNHDYVSILYNLSYLDTLAESFNYKKVARVCKIQISRYINRIVIFIINRTK